MQDFLQEACADDHDLYREVDALLQESELPTAALAKPVKQILANPQSGAFSGRMIGSYRLVEELGRGGMGVVYKAVRDDGELRMTAAIKLIKQNVMGPEIINRFRHERQLLADLRHPHIAPLLDAGTTEDGLPYFIMGYVDGTTIDRWCQQQDLDLANLLRLFRKVLDAVALAHRRGVIHRDIKPANVLVTSDGEPVLLDFGIALSIQNDAKGPSVDNSPMAMTPAYAAPEQILGKPATPRFDIYALGLLLLEIRRGSRIRRNLTTPQEQVHLLTRGEESTEDPREGAEPLIPYELAELLLAALAEDPEKRYATCEQMLTDLDYLLVTLAGEERSQGITNPKNQGYDAIFLYDHHDQTEVQKLLEQLQERGLELAPIHDQDPDETVAKFASTRTCVICQGAYGNIGWLQTSIRETLSQRVRRGHTKILPLLLPAGKRPEKESELPGYLRRRSWFQLSGDTAELDLLTDKILGRESLFETGEEPEICPFRGLEVFREQDRRFFYGREALTERLADHMAHHHFLAVLGPSGSGKSSVVQAGLMPLLRDMDYGLVLFTPATVPLQELALHVHRLFEEQDVHLAREQLERRMQQDNRSLHFILQELARVGGPQKLCVVIDQFEEIFTLAQHKEDVAHFLANLFYPLEQQEDNFALVLTLRSDFLGKCVTYPDLDDYLTENMYQVKPMSREDSRRAISEPARKVGLRFELGLLDKMLDDLAGDAGDLPLLEHALLELYQRRRGKWLTLAAYAEIGGIEGALARRAESTYNALNKQEQEVFRKMFTLCLVTPGEGAEDTRRRATRQEILAVSREEVALESLLGRLIDARLLTGHRDDNHHIEQVDVAHEALIRKWDRIKVWMAEDHEKARLLGRLRHRASAWEEAERADDFLLRGVQLSQMSDLIDSDGRHVGDLEVAFVRASIHMRERDQRQLRRRTRGIILAALVAALVFLVLFLNADLAKTEAQHQKLKAEQQTREANYNLAIAFNEKVDVALEKGNTQEAWLGSLAALTQDIPDDKDLPQARGRFLDGRMGGIDRLLWTSPVVQPIMLVASSSNGRTLAFVGSDRAIRLMDAHSGQQIALLTGANGIVSDLAFSPDDTLLVAASEDKEVYFWRVADGSLHLLRTEHQGRITSLALSQDGKWLATAAADGLVLIQSTTDDPDVAFSWRTDQVHDLVFGDGILYGATPKGIVRMDMGGSRQKSLLTSVQGEATALLWNPAGGLVSGWADGRVVFHHPQGVITEKIHQDRVLALTMDIAGNDVISSGADAVYRWKSAADDSLQATRLSDLSGLVSFVVNGSVLSGSDSAGRLQHRDLKIDGTSLLLGHRDGIRSVAFSSDGSLLASGSFDGTIILWDAEKCQPMASLSGHSDWVYGIAFSPDGHYLASASLDKTVKLWNVADASLQQTLTGHTDAVNWVAFSPDGKQLASCSWDQNVILWTAQAGSEGITYQKERVLTGHSAWVFCVAFSPDGSLLASSSDDNTIRLWDLSGKQPPKVLSGHTAGVISVAFSPDGKYLATGSDDQTVKLWTPSGEQVQTFKGHSGVVAGVAFSPDGKRLASSSFDQTLRIWDLTGGEAEVLTGHSGTIFAVAFSPDGKKLASGAWDLTLRLWDVSDRSTTVLRGHSAGVKTMAFSPNGKHLVSGSWDQTVRLWDLANGQSKALSGHSAPVFDVAFAPDGDRFASGSLDHTVRVWDRSGGEVTVLGGHSDGVYTLAFSPDGKQLASGSWDQTVRLWDLDGRETIVIQAHAAPVYDVAFSLDGQLLATASHDEMVKLWKPSGELVEVLRGHSAAVQGLAFSPDGQWLASCSSDQTVRLWDLSGGPTKILKGHLDRLTGVSFSPDGKWLATTSADHAANIWELSEDQIQLVLQGKKSDYDWYPYFSPDGSLLATPHDENTIRFWQMDKMVLPPKDIDSREWYAELLKRSLYEMGYYQEGFNFFPEPRMRLLGGSEPSSYNHLDRPRPAGLSYADWLMMAR